MAADDKERREKLSQLFGDQAASKMVPRSSREAAEDAALSPQMLQEGMQRLDWGQTRLVDVAMADGPLELMLEPLLPSSELLAVRLDTPLGLLLEEETQDEPPEGEAGEAARPPTSQVVVQELIDGGSALGGGVLIGDLVRATTYVTMGMSYPAWQLILGGVGTPKLMKQVMPTAGVPFDKVLAAITSNSQEQQGNGQAILLLERPL